MTPNGASFRKLLPRPLVIVLLLVLFLVVVAAAAETVKTAAAALVVFFIYLVGFPFISPVFHQEVVQYVGVTRRTGKPEGD